MKKLFLSLIICTLLAAQVIAQSIYVRAGSGFGLPIASAIIGSKYDHTSTNSFDTYTDESVTGSYGSGANFNLTFGYELNKNFVIELSSQYLISKKYKTYDNYSYFSSVSNTDYTNSSKGFFFNPSLIFSAGFGKAAPYGRVGIVLGSPKILSEESSFDDGDGISVQNRTWEYSKGLATGFQSAVGMNWQLSEKLDLFTELNFVSMTYYPGESNLIEYISNGTDYLPGMALSLTQTQYKKKVDWSSSNIDPNKPTTELREAFPFSSISLLLGIRFYILNKEE